MYLAGLFMVSSKTKPCSENVLCSKAYLHVSVQKVLSPNSKEEKDVTYDIGIVSAVEVTVFSCHCWLASEDASPYLESK